MVNYGNSVITQFSNHFKAKIISQLIKGISRLFRKPWSSSINVFIVLLSRVPLDLSL